MARADRLVRGQYATTAEERRGPAGRAPRRCKSARSWPGGRPFSMATSPWPTSLPRVALTTSTPHIRSLNPHGQLTGLVHPQPRTRCAAQTRATTRLQDIACPPSEVPTRILRSPSSSLGADERLRRWPRCGRRRRWPGRRRGAPPATSPAHCSCRPTCAPSIPIHHPPGPT